MNIIFFGILIALIIWGLFYQFKFILIYIGILSLYQILHILRKGKNYQSLRDKIALASWGETGNPTILARIEIDSAIVDSFLEEYNSKNSDSKLSYTIIGVKSLGEMMKNGNFSKCIKFGNVVKIPPKLIVLVDVEGKNLAQLPIEDVDKKGLLEIKDFMKGKITKIKNKKDQEFNKQMFLVNLFPTFIIQALLYTTHFITYSLGIDFPPLKAYKNQFGSGILTNVKGMQCQDAFAPHIEFCNTNFLMVITDPVDTCVVENGKITTKKILKLNMTFDQRFSEGDDIITAIKTIQSVWNNPEKYM